MVVLPAPLWPSNAQTVPAGTAKLTSRNAGTDPSNVLATLVTSITDPYHTVLAICLPSLRIATACDEKAWGATVLRPVELQGERPTRSRNLSTTPRGVSTMSAGLPVIAAIPNYNMGEHFRRLLTQLVNQDYDRIFVLDDASTDQVPRWSRTSGAM
jgi:hypothetical protein